MELSKQPESKAEQPTNSNRKRSVLKVLIILAISIFAITYFLSTIATWQFEKNSKQLFLDTNSRLTGQDISIDQVTYNNSTAETAVFRVKIYNPANYISPYAISINEVHMTSASELEVSAKSQTFSIVIPTVTLTNMTINYDIDSNREVNLHKIMDKMLLTYKENHLSSVNNDTKFTLHTVLIEHPMINIYKNRTIIKTFEIPSIMIPFNREKQITYAEAIISSSLQVIDIVDKATQK